MSEKPSEDPAEHARDFAQRWADQLDRYCAERMEELGIPPEQIGASDHSRGVSWRVFFPDEGDGGGISPGGRLNIDSGVLNPELVRPDYGDEAGELWAMSRLVDRIDAIIAHEEAERQCGTHEEALALAPRTTRRISGRARQLLYAMERGWIRD